MKNLVFFLAMAFMGQTLSAQGTGIYVQGGACGTLPMASFNSFESNSTSSGFAKPGYGWKIGGGYRFASKVFCELSFSQNSYKTDFTNQSNYYAQQYGMSSSVVADNYNLNFLLGGAGYSFNLSPRIQFDVKGMLGPVWSKRPSNTYYLSNNTTITQDAANSINMGFMLGTAFAFGVSDNVYLYGSVDFYFSSLSYDNVRTVAPTSVAFNNIKTFSASANPGLGIRFYF